ncbi:hypothetical protein FQN54_002908 [Arachnomyces sp. PD_36]|nr:hypothetical protein FQN54_002908 [Arachnomyces sp. PD_36]
MLRPLPGDVLCLICDDLVSNGEFNSLYQCALSGSSLAGSALRSLYRGVQPSSLVPAHKIVEIQTPRMGLMWHSIIASTFGRTYLPYYQFLRVFDLGPLEDFLASHRFEIKTKEIFFSEFIDVMDSWREYFEKPRDERNYDPARVKEIIEDIGDGIAPTSGNFPSTKGIGPQSLRIKNVIPHKFVDRARPRSLPPNDHLEKFLQDLPPNTLKNLTLTPMGSASFPTSLLSSQAESLTKIIFNTVQWESIASFSSLGPCPNLKVLVFRDALTPMMRESDMLRESDTSTKFARWICSCGNLTHLELGGVYNAVDIATAVVLDGGIKLRILSISGAIGSAKALHEGLKNQTSLEQLHLTPGMADLSLTGASLRISSDKTILIQSLCRLSKLQDLELSGVSDKFTSPDIVCLAAALPNLRSLVTGGDLFDDLIWEKLVLLPKLRLLRIYARSRFTADAILDFASRVGNRAFTLAILGQEEEARISSVDKERIEQCYGTGPIPTVTLLRTFPKTITPTHLTHPTKMRLLKVWAMYHKSDEPEEQPLDNDPVDTNRR